MDLFKSFSGLRTSMISSARLVPKLTGVIKSVFPSQFLQNQQVGEVLWFYWLIYFSRRILCTMTSRKLFNLHSLPLAYWRGYDSQCHPWLRYTGTCTKADV